MTRAISLDESVGVQSELVEGPLFELLDAYPLLGASDLVAVHMLGQPLELGTEFPDSLAHLAELAVALRTVALDLSAHRRRIGQRPLRASHAEFRRGCDAVRDANLTHAALASRPVAVLLLATCGGGASQRCGPAVQSPDPLFGAAYAETRLGFGLPGGTGRRP
jgi:hypothetical protein